MIKEAIKLKKIGRANKTTVKKLTAKAIKKPNLKLGDDGYEAQFIGVVTEAIMDVIGRRMDDINTGLHISLEKSLDDFRIYGEMISSTNDNVRRLSDKVDDMAEDIVEIKGRLDGIDGRLDGIDGRLDNLEGDVGQIKNYIFKNVEPRIHMLEFRDKTLA